MAISPEIALQFQPNQALVNAPQQAIALGQLGSQEKRRRDLISLNQMPGMTEGGLYTDQGLIALSQIDPGLRDQAVMQRAKVLESASRERARVAQEDKIRDAERQDAIDDIMLDVAAKYYSTPGAPESRQAAMVKQLNSAVDDFVKDGRAAKFGMTPEMIQKLRTWNSVDNIQLALLKHGKTKAAEYLQGLAGAQATEGGSPTAPTSPTAVSGAPAPDEPTVKPFSKNIPEGQPIDGVDEATFEEQASKWDDYEKEISDRWRSGQMSVQEYETELAAIDAEKEKIKAGREKFAQAKEGPDSTTAPEVGIAGEKQDDYIAMAREEERKAAALRKTGMPGNLKRAEAHDKQARAYRSKANEAIRIEQKDRSLDQADERIKLALERAKATQQALPEDAVDFVAKQIINGNQQAGTGLARNQVAKAQIITRYTELAKQKGLSPEQVNANFNAFQGLGQASRTLGTRAANIDLAVAELKQFIGPAEKASDAVPRSNFVPLNKLLQMSANQWSPEQAAFVAANRTVINIYASLASRGVPTVHSTQEAENMLSTAQTPAQYKAVLRQLWTEAEAARKAPGMVREDIRRAITGEETPPEPYPGGKEAPTKKSAPTVSRETPNGAYSDPDKEKRYQEWKKKNGY